MVLMEEELYERMRAEQLQDRGGEYYQTSFHAMGTPCQLMFAAPSSEAADRFRTSALQWLASFEAKYSRYIEDSMICEINRQAGRAWVPIDAELESIFTLCDWYHWMTKGIFDPTSLPLIMLWNYQAHAPRVPTQAEVESCLELINWKSVERDSGRVRLPKEGMAIDLGGIGKEYAVDRVIELAMEHGLANVLVDFGHDIRVIGEPPEGGPWRIGLELPSDPERCWGGVALQDRAVTSSAAYQRFFEADGKRYGHILDLRSGYPVNNGCESVTVVSPTCTEAGILSTAAFVLGPDGGLNLLDGCQQAEGCLWMKKDQLRSKSFERYVI